MRTTNTLSKIGQYLTKRGLGRTYHVNDIDRSIGRMRLPNPAKHLRVLERALPA